MHMSSRVGGNRPPVGVWPVRTRVRHARTHLFLQGVTVQTDKVGEERLINDISGGGRGRGGERGGLK